jgi:hypothetical protein
VHADLLELALAALDHADLDGGEAIFGEAVFGGGGGRLLALHEDSRGPRRALGVRWRRQRRRRRRRPRLDLTM